MVHLQDEVGIPMPQPGLRLVGVGAAKRIVEYTAEGFDGVHMPPLSEKMVGRTRTEDPASEQIRDRVVGRIGSPESLVIRGEGVQIKVYKTQQGFVMRADHVVRDFLDGVHKELGDIVRLHSASRTPVGFAPVESKEFDTVKLEGLINRGILFLEDHAGARFDGLPPSLVVRNISSVALKLFEHLRLDYIEALSDGRLTRSEQRAVLGRLIEVRAELRQLVHHFDAQMFPIEAELMERKQGGQPGGDGPRAA